MRAALTSIVFMALAAPAVAQHEGHDPATGANDVVMRFAMVAPDRLGVLPGDTVSWHNISQRNHTVTATAGDFDSGVISPDGSFSRAFQAVGDFPYFCRLHASVKGTIVVRDAILEGPREPVTRGETFTLNGRAGARELTLLRDEQPQSSVTPGPDGLFSIALTADATAQWQVTGSDPVRVEVIPQRTVTLARHGRFLYARVSPPVRDALVVLQLRLRERFGWWPVRGRRTDARGTARFRAPSRRAPARAALMHQDGATVLAHSNTLRLR